MALLDIVLYPDPILLRKMKAVEVFDDDLREFLSDMTETMYSADGLGLAAPQVDVDLRVCIVDAPERMKDGSELSVSKLYQMVNPEIVKGSGEIEWEEGCLSLPGFLQKKKRYQSIECVYQNGDGEKQVLHAQGLLAVAIQHEIDHLDGKLILDDAGQIKRDIYEKKLAKGKFVPKYKVKKV